MTAVLANGRTSVIQNSAAAAVFLLLLTAQAAAFLLDAFPASEWLWEACIALNRIASPVLYKFDAWTGLGAMASLAVLGSCTLFPLAAHLRRSWLGTAVSAHVALGMCVVMTLGAVKRAQTPLVSASLSPAFEPRLLDTNSVTLALATLAMVGLCAINHIVFFHRSARG